MKTMLFSDYLSIRRSLPQSLALAVIVAFICAIFGGVSFAGAIVCAMAPVTIVFSVQLYDDQNDWSGYRLTLPVDRHQVVWGRYLFMALCAVGAFLIGCVIVLIHELLAQSGLLSQPSTALSAMAAGESLSLLDTLLIGFGGTYLALMFVLLLLAVTLPLLMRYGLTQAIRLVPVVCCVIFILVMIWLGDTGSNVLSWLDSVFMDGIGALWLLGLGMTVLCGALYIGSAALTTRLYAAREF